MATNKLKVNTRIFRTFLQPNYAAPTFADGPAPIQGQRHGAFVDPASDEFGRQYVVAMRDEDREFSERLTVYGRGSSLVFLGHRLLVDTLYGYNSHPSQLMFVQLWQVGGWDWQVNGETVSDQSRMIKTAGSHGVTPPRLITTFPVQPNYGTFSLDGPLMFRKGLSIAISATDPNEDVNWTNPGNYLYFTCFARQRETGVNVADDINT